MNTRTSNRLVTAADDVLEIIQWDQAYNRNGLKINRTVMNVLRTYANNTTLRVEKISIARLEEATGLSRRGIIKQIQENIDAGWLSKPSRGNSGGSTNTYQLTYGRTSESLKVVNYSAHYDSPSELQFTTPSELECTTLVNYSAPRSELECTPTTHITTQKETTNKTTHIETSAEAMGSVDPLEETTGDFPSLSGIPDGREEPYALVNRETGSQLGSSDRTADTSPLENSTMSNTVGSSAQPCGASAYAVCKKDPFMDDYTCSTHDEFIEPEPEVLPPPVSSWGRPKCGSSSCSDPECAVHGGLSQTCPF